MTYRDLVRRSEHPYAGSKVGGVTNPTAGRLPEPRTHTESYRTGPLTDRELALPYAGASPQGTPDWAIREWAVRVWAARDSEATSGHGAPADDSHHPAQEGGSHQLDWDLLDSDTGDVTGGGRTDDAPRTRTDTANVPVKRSTTGRDDTFASLDLAEADLADIGDDLDLSPDASGEATPTALASHGLTPEPPPAPAGPPPPHLYAAAILTAVLSLPLLLSAGVLVAVARTIGIGAVVALFLAVLSVVAAASDVVGALRLADRGDPKLARVGGYITLSGTVLSAGWLLLDGTAAGVLFPIWTSFGVVAMVMFGLIGTGPGGRWLAARERERRAAHGYR